MPSTHSHSHSSHGHGGSHRHHSSHHATQSAASPSRAAHGSACSSHATTGGQPQHRHIYRIPTQPVRSETRQSDEQHRHSHRTPAASESPAASGKSISVLCVTTAFLGLGIELANEFVAHANQTNTNTFFSVLTSILCVVAVGLGICAQASQQRRWNPHTRQRLVVGFPVAALTLLAVAPNFRETPVLRKNSGNSGDASRSLAASPLPTNVRDVNDALVKPGWYGEYQQDGVVLVVSSYEENAFESRCFNRRLAKPVSYAALSAINLGCATPVVLNSLRVGLRLDSGETVQSLAIEPLLAKNASTNGDLLKRLAPPQRLAIGDMLPDVPICMEADFSWSRVTAVTVTLDAREVLIPGRIMTAAEKNAMLEKNTERRPSAKTQGSAESWFKNL